MDSELFRKEALDAQATSWLGTVRLATPISHTMWTSAALLCGIAVSLWLWFGHYTRREHVIGNLVPQAGLIDLVARASGTVSRAYVTEGALVHAGDPLLALSGERSSETLGDTSAAISAQLRDQQASLQADLADARHLAAQQAVGLQTQKTMLAGQLQQLDAQLAIARHQVRSTTILLEKIRPLETKGYISAFQIQQQEAQVLDAESQVKALLRQRYETAQQASNMSDQLSQLPLAAKAKFNDLHRQLVQGDQNLAQNEAERSTVVRALQSGTVSSLLVKPGQAVAAGQSLLAMVPENSPLQAQLLVPSSAVGFVREGTAVVLHYQAFPYQKFGVQHGEVEQVSRSALTPSEVTVLLGQQPPSEALYRVQVTLSSQTVVAYGKPESLKPGMTLDADLLLDRRRLIEWIFEPLYGMHRRAEGAE
jgi:membrane fusion protein